MYSAIFWSRLTLEVMDAHDTTPNPDLGELQNQIVTEGLMTSLDTSGLQCTHYLFVTLTVIWGTALLHTCDGTTQRTRNTPLLGPRVGRCRVLLEARGPKKYSFTRTRLQRYRAVREPPAPSGNCNCEHSVRQTSTFGDEVIPLIRRSCQRPQRAQGSRGARQIYSP